MPRAYKSLCGTAAADDIATALRVDFEAATAFTVGGSAFYQRAGQDGTREGAAVIPEMDTVIAEAHLDWRPGPVIARALWASVTFP